MVGKEEKWYFSVVDIVAILAQNKRPRKYWDDLKRKLKQEGGQLSEKIGQLKLLAKDGKYYLTDVADVETLLRIIRSICGWRIADRDYRKFYLGLVRSCVASGYLLDGARNTITQPRGAAVRER